MEQIYLDELDDENAYFHFTNTYNLQTVSKTGLEATIGVNSNGVEDTKKVFFSKGKRGLLQIADVWIKWMMNNAYGMKDMYGFQKGMTTEERKKGISIWIDEFLSGDYLQNEKRKNEMFALIYDKMQYATYLSLSLEEGRHYLPDDIDENKVRNLKNREKNERAFLFQQEMYGTYSDSTSPIMDRWNMHTKTGVGVEPTLLKQIKARNNRTDLFSIIEETYRTYKTPDKLDILPSFIEYGRKRRQEEIHNSELNEMFSPKDSKEEKSKGSELSAMLGDNESSSKINNEDKKSQLNSMFENKGNAEKTNSSKVNAKTNN